MNTKHVSVAVLGGGVAGLCAALQCARAGLSTMLVEKNAMAGGTLTSCGINFPGIFHAWHRQIIRGIGWELVTRTLERCNQKLPRLDFEDMSQHPRYQVRLNALAFAATADDALMAAGVDVAFHTMIGRVVWQPDAEQYTVTLCDKDGLYDITADYLIDATGDANATFMAGLPVRTLNPCQPGTMNLFATNYDVETLDFDALEKAFDAAVAAGELQVSDMGWSGKFNRAFFYDHGNNCNHINGINAANSAGRTRMEMEGRKILMRLLQFLRRQKGLEKIDFRLGGGDCGVRETRTIVGESSIQVEDYVAGRVFDDALCYSYYPVDLHDAEAGLKNIDIAEGAVPTIPRGALIPRSSHHFLAAGRIVSGDRLANSAYRVQASCMATGQAAGATAVIAARAHGEPLAADLAAIRDLLKEHNAIVPC